MITLRQSKQEELSHFVDMERQAHACRFINGTDLQTHQSNFQKQNTVYLSIDDDQKQLAGYFILVISTDTKEVEFQSARIRL